MKIAGRETKASDDTKKVRKLIAAEQSRKKGMKEKRFEIEFLAVAVWNSEFYI